MSAPKEIRPWAQLVKLLSCDWKVTGSSPRNNLLCKNQGKAAYNTPNGGTPSRILRMWNFIHSKSMRDYFLFLEWDLTFTRLRSACCANAKYLSHRRWLECRTKKGE
ncbi:hypothetical protein MTR_2g040170 [Medicago truncatula]|uniref:Uncharacterized protein n=1 Tax=Medicago truncatula TaxID=3880 RepID=G7IQ91_MEDTR|nr:hypothetical protein MTR_2g040170 [Medicago truncatula]